MRIKNLITALSIIVFSSCITIPDLPKNESPECLAHYFETRSKMKNYRHTQWVISATVGYISLSLAWAAGPDGLFPLVSLPYFLYINNNDANEIYQNYQQTHCNKKNSV
ncbi:hypothetical protein [Leptospira meyeri]|uniref:hypothetical protein n=1 Tax=Leptospira meyeri TaxID=29508 RepID=UPI00223D3247|nr:hypothetical protein [Leptospira meyeri]MCW7490939.1 hypothetical protein [Leptospira meyeri]